MEPKEEEEVKNESSLAISIHSSGRKPNSTPSSPPPYRIGNGPSSPPSSWFEIRLFYVRISPCAPDSIPDHLTLSHLRREIGVALEINGARVPASRPTSIPLRRDRLDRNSSEVTYVSTDSVRITGPVDFEVHDTEDLVICGSLERMEPPWSNGRDSKTGWSMDCYSAASLGSSAFVQPKLGISSPLIEVYVAGCSSGHPLIMTQTIQLSPRRKMQRQGMLDAIPEDEESSGREQGSGESLLLRRRTIPEVGEGESDEYNSELKGGRSFYAEGGYYDDDGELSWFNAGVRVGVGIGLGMCLGIEIGVGLLMRSYQATTRTFKRQFF